MNRKAVVYNIVSLIPKGKILTYQKVAELSGYKSPRVIGNILHKNPDPTNIPCHRVVNYQGELADHYAFGGLAGQKEKLFVEGIKILDKSVDLTKYLWHPSLLFNSYCSLLSQYGDPGPWPWFQEGVCHSKDEIAIGAILTQNTNWKNVEKSLDNLRNAKSNNLKQIYLLSSQSPDLLKEYIKPSGFYNQKFRYLAEFSKLVIDKYTDLTYLSKQPIIRLREELLSTKGIGPETADTILLYCLSKPVFVVDNYTKRFLDHLGIVFKPNYYDIQSYITQQLPKSSKFFQDFHALIVKWGKVEKTTNK